MRTVDMLIKTWDVWIGIGDATSSIMSGYSDAYTVEAVRSLVASAALLKMEVVVDGTYSVRFIDDPEGGAPSLGPDTEVGLLALPSGRVMIRTGHSRIAPVHVLTVAPGRYETRVLWSVEEECKHYDLEPATYPPGDGPDGIVVLRRIGG